MAAVNILSYRRVNFISGYTMQISKFGHRNVDNTLKVIAEFRLHGEFFSIQNQNTIEELANVAK